MKLRVVAIPLFAAIALASPAITSGEQAQRGRGYRPHDGGGGTQTAERNGGDNNRGGGDRPASTTSKPAERRAEPRTGDRDQTASTNDSRAEQRRGETRARDRGDDNERYAVPRSNARVNVSGPRDNRPVVVSGNGPNFNFNIGSYRGSRYAPVHYDAWARQYYRWSPIRYAPWSLIYGSIGYSNWGFYGGVGPSPYYYGYNNGYGYSYGPGPYSPWQAGGYDIGGLRLKIRPRDAQVFVDGYYAGLVDDFDGSFQSLRLEAGGHKIEIHMAGFEDLELDVHVQPGRTLTLAEQLKPRP
ncbi:MAG TPA: PEGA domain-containing protein [Vicinamibacterales bacterium]|nr:PEGA domain-containing protein [Vicinamibacterales bacterium]